MFSTPWCLADVLNHKGKTLTVIGGSSSQLKLTEIDLVLRTIRPSRTDVPRTVGQTSTAGKGDNEERGAIPLESDSEDSLSSGGYLWYASFTDTVASSAYVDVVDSRSRCSTTSTAGHTPDPTAA